MPWSSSARSQRRLVAPRRLRSISARTVGVGGVDADVERRQPLGDHPLEVGLGEAGERGEVPVEERQPVVVVLQVEAPPQPRRQLVDEAELAVVVAGAHLVEQRGVHLDAERLARRPWRTSTVQLEPAPPHVELRGRPRRPAAGPLDDVAGHLAVRSRAISSPTTTAPARPATRARQRRRGARTRWSSLRRARSAPSGLLSCRRRRRRGVQAERAPETPHAAARDVSLLRDCDEERHPVGPRVRARRGAAAVTVAVRGTSASSATSPKNPPARRHP